MTLKVNVPAGLRPLLSAEGFADAMTSMAWITTTYVAYTDSGSALRAVLVTTMGMLPAIVLGVPAARAVNRFDARRVLVVGNNIKIVVYAAMTLFDVVGWLNANTVLVFSLILGCISAMQGPSFNAWDHTLVDDDHLDDLNAVFGAVYAAGMIFGSVLFGLTVSVAGYGAPFVLAGVSLLVLNVLVMRADQPNRREREKDPAALKATFAYMRTNPPLRRALTRLAVLSLLVTPIFQLLAPIAAEIHPGPHMLGYVGGVISLGAAVVIWRLPQLKARHTNKAIERRSLGACALCLIGLGIADVFADSPILMVPVLAVLFLIGMVSAVANAVLVALVQVRAAGAHEGGVLAALGIVVGTCAALGGLVFGTFADHVDVFQILTAAGLLLGCYWAATGLRP